MNQILSYVFQFFLGGGIIVGMSVLTKYANPKWAALLYALPIQFTVALFFIAKSQNTQTANSLLINSAIALGAVILFIGLVYILLQKTTLLNSAIISYSVLLILFILIFIIKK